MRDTKIFHRWLNWLLLGQSTNRLELHHSATQLHFYWLFFPMHTCIESCSKRFRNLSMYGTSAAAAATATAASLSLARALTHAKYLHVTCIRKSKHSRILARARVSFHLAACNFGRPYAELSWADKERERDTRQLVKQRLRLSVRIECTCRCLRSCECVSVYVLAADRDGWSVRCKMYVKRQK